VSGQGRDPWADPTTPTQQGPPYAGPPPTAPQPWAPAPYGAPSGYGWAPGFPGYPPPGVWASPRPSRPGQVIAAAVLAFVQAAVALIGTLYTYMLSALVGLSAGQGSVAQPGLAGLASEGTTLAVVQVLSVVPLVVGGFLVLNRRSPAAWRTLVAALVVQVLIALYWALRLSGAVGDAFDADAAPLAAFTLFFVAAPLVGLGLLAFGAGRRWFGEARGV
jgi:hypothetical protein